MLRAKKGLGFSLCQEYLVIVRVLIYSCLCAQEEIIKSEMNMYINSFI